MENFYTILGVANTASASEIKTAYLKLARQFHPDKYTDDEAKKKANDQFSKITEAYRVLSDDKLRHDYNTSMDKGTKPQDEAQETQAKNAFQRGIAFLKQNDPWRAVNLLRIACRYNCQPMYESYLGLALVYTKQYSAEGFEKLKGAAHKMMFNPYVHINLGLAYEFTGNVSEAEKSFHEALNWDAKNEVARRALARLAPKKTGFFGKLFGDR